MYYVLLILMSIIKILHNVNSMPNTDKLNYFISRININILFDV